MLGSILGALKSIVNVIGMTRMTPPIKDLLPRLTPILKNRCVGGWTSPPSSKTDARSGGPTPILRNRCLGQLPLNPVL